MAKAFTRAAKLGPFNFKLLQKYYPFGDINLNTHNQCFQNSTKMYGVGELPTWWKGEWKFCWEWIVLLAGWNFTRNNFEHPTLFQCSKQHSREKTYSSNAKIKVAVGWLHENCYLAGQRQTIGTEEMKIWWGWTLLAWEGFWWG